VSETKTVYILEDHPLTVLGLEGLLSHSFPRLRVIGRSDNLEKASREIGQLEPNLLLTDLTLKDGLSVSFIQQLQLTLSDTHIVVVTQNENQEIHDQLRKSGVNAIVLKSAPHEHLLKTLSLVLGNQSTIPVKTQVQPVDSTLNYLTPREGSVVRLITQGHTTKEIADLLGCSSETIKSHKSSILSKTNSRNSAEVSAWAVKNHFI
jgi:DNA-binding NarL/FixJ family response regulator